MKLKKLAEKYYKQFILKTRNNGDKFYCIRDNAPDRDFLTDMVRECHDGKFPDDYIYAYIVESLEGITQYDDPERYLDDIQADCYTSDLLDYVRSHSERLANADEAISVGVQSITDAISMAQVREKTEVFNYVLHTLNEQLENEG